MFDSRLLCPFKKTKVDTCSLISFKLQMIQALQMFFFFVAKSPKHRKHLLVRVTLPRGIRTNLLWFSKLSCKHAVHHSINCHTVDKMKYIMQ